jgi:hypothetical protein
MVKRMDITGVLSGIADKGGRVALAFACCGACVLAAHHYNWPEPGVLTPWLGPATVAGALGLSVTVIAAFSHIGRWVKGGVANYLHETRQQQEMVKLYAQRKKEMFDRIDLLDTFQQVKLRELLEQSSGSMFMLHDGDGPAHSLVDAGFIEYGNRQNYGTVCKFHPILEHERQAVLAHLGR